METQRPESTPLHRRAIRKGGPSENSHGALLKRKQEKTIGEALKVDVENVGTSEINDDIE